MAHKRYDNQADEYPLYLYEGHELTNPKRYIDKLHAILDKKNPTPRECMQYEILSQVAFELFGGNMPLIEIKRNQVKEVIRLLTLRHKGQYLQALPLTAIDISTSTKALYTSAEFYAVRYKDCITAFETIIEEIIHSCYIYNTMLAKYDLTEQEQADYYIQLDKCIEQLENQRQNIMKLYKAMNCYDIYIDMLADFTGVEELQTLKVNLFEAKEQLQVVNIRYIQMNNAILGINPVADTQIVEPTQEAQKRADKVLKLAINLNSRLLRPSLRIIDEAYNKLFAVDIETETDGIVIFTDIYNILFYGIEDTKEYE